MQARAVEQRRVDDEVDDVAARADGRRTSPAGPSCAGGAAPGRRASACARGGSARLRGCWRARAVAARRLRRTSKPRSPVGSSTTTWTSSTLAPVRAAPCTRRPATRRARRSPSKHGLDRSVRAGSRTEPARPSDSARARSTRARKQTPCTRRGRARARGGRAHLGEALRRRRAARTGTEPSGSRRGPPGCGRSPRAAGRGWPPTGTTSRPPWRSCS